jgi:chaperonin GroEL
MLRFTSQISKNFTNTTTINFSSFTHQQNTLRPTTWYIPNTFQRSYAKDVRFGAEARQLMLKGARKMANAIAVTLGPKGRNVVISQFSAPKITKDGVTVAKSIDFSNPHENVGAQLIKNVANKTNDQAGDGTTTASILSLAIFEAGCEKVAGGLNAMDIWRGVNKAVDKCVQELKKLSIPVSNEQIRQVATVSANGDERIGQLIADGLNRVGKNGVLTVETGKSLVDEIEVIEGMKFDQGYLSPAFVTDNKSLTTELKDAAILVVDHKISNLRSVLPILEQALANNKPLLIIAADGLETEVLTVLAYAKSFQGLKLCAVKAPGYGDNRTSMLQDIATVTGTEVISTELGMKLDDVKFNQLGSAKTVTVTQDSTLILGGGGSKESIKERCEIIQEKISSTDSEYDRQRASERLAKLSGGVGIIKVGGASELEVNEKKDRIVDALNATRAALEEGIVPGGGSALLYCGETLKDVRGDNFDQDVGIQIIRTAIQAPIKTIASNAGIDGAIIVGKLLTDPINKNMGYNAQTGKFVDMLKEGIIDPTKVVRIALIDAASVASILTTTNCLITEEPEKEKDI